MKQSSKKMKVARGTARRISRENGVRTPVEAKAKAMRQQYLLALAQNPLRWAGTPEKGHYEMRMPDGEWESRAIKD